mgnify:CR=1 FL=1
MNGIRARTAHKIGIVLLGVLLATSLAACGGSDDSDDIEEASAGAAPMAAATMAGASAQSDSSAAPADLAPATERMVIRTADIRLRVDDVAAAVITVRDMAQTNGGFVFSSSTHNDGDSQFAQITIRVPSDRYEDTLNQLRSATWVDRVESEESSSQDVSGEYVDNESQLRTLRETQSRLLDLLSRAESIDDILRLELELQKTRGQIERIQGRQQYLDNATAYSTISVSLSPVAGPAVADDDGFSLSTLLERGWNHARGAVEALVVASVTIGILAVFVAPLALLAFVVFRRVRASTSDTPAA